MNTTIHKSTPKLLKSYDKTDLSKALQLARMQSRKAPRARLVVENYEDANGVSVWMHSNRTPDNKQIYLFVGGKQKRSVA